jgi:hypothetical protein
MAINPTMTTAGLLALFRANCLAQDETYISGNAKNYNKLFAVNVNVVKELASRPGDGRRALLPLLNDENPHVRLQAAKFAYPVAPSECRACLEAIRAAKLPDQSLDAGMTLRSLDRDPHCLDGT